MRNWGTERRHRVLCICSVLSIGAGPSKENLFAALVSLAQLRNAKEYFSLSFLIYIIIIVIINFCLCHKLSLYWFLRMLLGDVAHHDHSFHHHLQHVHCILLISRWKVRSVSVDLWCREDSLLISHLEPSCSSVSPLPPSETWMNHMLIPSKRLPMIVSEICSLRVDTFVPWLNLWSFSVSLSSSFSAFVSPRFSIMRSFPEWVWHCCWWSRLLHYLIKWKRWFWASLSRTLSHGRENVSFNLPLSLFFPYTHLLLNLSVQWARI